MMTRRWCTRLAAMTCLVFLATLANAQQPGAERENSKAEQREKAKKAQAKAKKESAKAEGTETKGKKKPKRDPDDLSFNVTCYIYGVSETMGSVVVSGEGSDPICNTAKTKAGDAAETAFDPFEAMGFTKDGTGFYPECPTQTDAAKKKDPKKNRWVGTYRIKCKRLLRPITGRVETDSFRSASAIAYAVGSAHVKDKCPDDEVVWLKIHVN